MLAITSDYYRSIGDPRPSLKRIADAGFTHIHWCHHWNTDFLYSDHEIEEIKRWFKEYGLSLLNLHASHGDEKYWISHRKYQRLAGIELVQNRIRMTAKLGGNVIILHIPTTEPKESRPAKLKQIRKSLDQLEPFARSHSMQIALENMTGDDFEMLDTLLAEYEPEFIGLCYDSGHANLNGQGFKDLERLKHRLIAIHLHDNEGSYDEHNIPFTGSVDWEELATVIASSAYEQCVNLEVVFRKGKYPDEDTFLQHAHLAGEKLTALIDATRELSQLRE